MSHALQQLWPPFGLLIECGPLSLAPVRDSDLPDLVALAHEGIHDAAAMPFDFPWTAGTPRRSLIKAPAVPLGATFCHNASIVAT